MLTRNHLFFRQPESKKAVSLRAVMKSRRGNPVNDAVINTKPQGFVMHCFLHNKGFLKYLMQCRLNACRRLFLPVGFNWIATILLDSKISQ